MVFIILCILLSVLVGFIGFKKNTGFWPNFFNSIAQSPFVGIFYEMDSNKKDKKQRTEIILETQVQQQMTLEKFPNKLTSNRQIALQMN